jgi:hypothetical protein
MAATVVFAALAFAHACYAEEVVRELPWTRSPTGATLVAPRAGRTGASIRIERGTGGSVPLVRIDRPPLANCR